MPFTGTTFSYTNPGGATGATAGQVVQSAVWDQIHTDIQNALTNVYTSVETSVSVLNAAYTGTANTLASVTSQMQSLITLRNFVAANGSFEVWQRGAGGSATFTISGSTSNTYTADRWYIGIQATSTSSVGHVVSATTGLSSPSNLAGKIIRNSGVGAVGPVVFAYPFDTPEIVRMHGLKVVLTGLASTGAAWSPTNGTISIILYAGTGAVARRNITPYTNETQVFALSQNIAAGSSATALQATISSAIVPTTTTQMELQISWTPVGSAGATDFITFDDIQVEGLNYTGTWNNMGYDRIPGEIETILCKRFYQKTFDYSTAPAQAATLVGALSTTAIATQPLNFFWDFPVDMRVAPTVTTYNPTQSSANWESVSLSVDSTSVAVIVRTSNAGTKGVTITSTTSGAVTNTYCYIHAALDAGI